MVRFKNRYIVVEVNPTKSSDKGCKLELNSGSLQGAILKKLDELHGDFGIAAVRSGFLIKYCNPQTRVAYIRVRHGPHQLLASALPLVTQIHHLPATLRTLYTGASLLQCNKFLRRHQLEQLRAVLPKVRTQRERELIQQTFLKLDALKQE